MSEQEKLPANVKDGTAPSTRRKFVKQLAQLAVQATAGAVLLSGFLALRSSRTDLPGFRAELGILRPPGALDEDGFLARCIHCTLCADVCDPQCIRYFGAEAGNHHGTPYILPEEVACTMCLKCTTACPTEALKPIEEMEDIDMGEAVIDERLCLPFIGTSVCGACLTVCPLKQRALTIPVFEPEIHTDHCTGCGLCVEICPVHSPYAVQIKTDRVQTEFQRDVKKGRQWS